MKSSETKPPFDVNDEAVSSRLRDPEWLRRAAAFLAVYERVGPVKDNTWRLRRK